MKLTRLNRSFVALALWSVACCALALAQTSSLQPLNPPQTAPVAEGQGKKKSGKKSGKKKSEQAVSAITANPPASASGTTAATMPEPAEVALPTGKGKKNKGGGKGMKSGGANNAATSVRAVLDAQVSAWNAGKLEDFMRGYWNSPELTFVSGGRKLWGYDATLERYRRTYQAEGKELGKLTFGDLEIMPMGAEAAFVRGQWQLVMSDARELGGRFTLVLRQFAEGWKIVHDHTSANQ